MRPACKGRSTRLLGRATPGARNYGRHEEQKGVKTTVFDLVNPESPRLQYHKLDRAKDRRFWSVRVSRDLRIIVHRDGDSVLPGPPLVLRSPPPTIRSLVFSNPLEGMTRAESAALLGFLREHVTQEACTCRLRREKNTFAIWDNRSCIHRCLQRLRWLPARDVPHDGARGDPGLNA